MRVITGSARGRKLLSPTSSDIRPTSDMVKEAIFSILQNELEGAMVLDLFAGSGQLGIEALSRGARFAVFVDSSREAQEVIRNNLQTTRLAEQGRVAAMEYQAFLAGSKDTFDIALLDPPYQQGILDKALPLLIPRMSESGVIVCETDNKELLPQRVESFVRRREYRYGRKKLTLYRKEEESL